jgi:hypothetical protein
MSVCINYMDLNARSIYYTETQTGMMHSTKNLLKKKKFKELSDLFEANVNGLWREVIKTYVKPLLTFGCEVLDPNDNDINELSKSVGNALKIIIGIIKKCHTTPLYAALSIESTKNIVLKQQMKFTLRAQDNEYVEEFLQQSHLPVNNEGMIGKIIMDQGWKYTVTLSELNECIKYKLEENRMNVIDSYFYIEEAQRVKSIFQIKNAFLRS